MRTVFPWGPSLIRNRRETDKSDYSIIGPKLNNKTDETTIIGVMQMPQHGYDPTVCLIVLDAL